MKQRVSLITLGVAEVERSRTFYERIGWKRSNAKAEEIVLSGRRNGSCFVSRVALAKDANVSPDGFGFCGITLAYHTRTRDEVDAVLAQAGDAGAKVQSCSSPRRKPSGAGIPGTLPTRVDSCGRSHGTHAFQSRKTTVSESLRRFSSLFWQSDRSSLRSAANPVLLPRPKRMGYARAFRRAFDSQPLGRSG
jgi:catechol 2,3-dioxygenase-like lactoylglutathione lyase family enzyme